MSSLCQAFLEAFVSAQKSCRMWFTKIILLKSQNGIIIAFLSGKALRARVSFREIPQHWLITIAAFCTPEVYSSIYISNLQRRLRSPRRN
jgi:hypothetical protein